MSGHGAPGHLGKRTQEPPKTKTVNPEPPNFIDPHSFAPNPKALNPRASFLGPGPNPTTPSHKAINPTLLAKALHDLLKLA